MKHSLAGWHKKNRRQTVRAEKEWRTIKYGPYGGKIIMYQGFKEPPNTLYGVKQFRTVKVTTETGTWVKECVK